jgi:ZIP family zinc transporter
LAQTAEENLLLTYGVLFATVAGMMTYISFAELIPTALKFEPKQKNVAVSIFTGMAIMAFSIVMFKLAEDPEAPQ